MSCILHIETSTEACSVAVSEDGLAVFSKEDLKGPSHAVQLGVFVDCLLYTSSYVNISGRTRVGYEIDALIEVLERFLGFTKMHKAFLFGVGSLGGALLRDSGLHHFGLEIVGAFDINPELVGKEINGIPIYHSDEFEVDVYKRQVLSGCCCLLPV